MLTQETQKPPCLQMMPTFIFLGMQSGRKLARKRKKIKMTPQFLNLYSGFGEFDNLEAITTTSQEARSFHPRF